MIRLQPRITGTDFNDVIRRARAMINGDENYEFDIEEGWTEPKKAESGAATEQKPNGGGQSLRPPLKPGRSPTRPCFMVSPARSSP